MAVGGGFDEGSGIIGGRRNRVRVGGNNSGGVAGSDVVGSLISVVALGISKEKQNLRFLRVSDRVDREFNFERCSYAKNMERGSQKIPD